MAGGGTVVVAEAPDAVSASIWLDALRDAGIEAGMFERGVGAALGGAATPGLSRFAIVVRKEAMLEARNVIAEVGGASRLAPYRDGSEAPGAQRRAIFFVVVLIAAGIAGVIVGRLVA
jgi:hypothetical protein